MKTVIQTSYDISVIKQRFCLGHFLLITYDGLFSGSLEVLYNTKGGAI